MSESIYSKDHQYLIEQLKKARHEARLDQKAVAKLLSKTQSYVSKIESGQRKIDVIQLKKFAYLYKKNINYFIK
ncbi:hypothetical protein CO115_04610 [Candidatus Falkowbacteria bacterium CG_4_9_14_3_um_filter_36_9]|uniref:HTH cro/C1-type domain-containing protein n=2 Tax=Candidatus Falkowiibacteriota TaxID=1752728 RepID=A0A1J4TBS6_9BACT|nr:MAG: hypothetical protein AUJ27_02050 [Candidatus Falkowbacteria bacterium CG1_02_37_44]PIV51432.1 MAG: hypothetical protein COS18_02765 [Candidatus Falkowbacteria bacterium CG02_land_8_20_14_3_00_36_14]PIX11041.1 MAG: hypothetical protein COZ73_03745 [Candidatus Falkowbacteria bacterium CG_4_8_14_3_um_filter_36_11]PJA10454.1 MAG: hypothetical protein COX67_04635 [Candidatus Falkowbacteria bacterium CG_4_10_14_0_2_um_filter_36_22]PJB18411.1 MAG: hypothetical protein CO115_04610 [Candidatus F